MRLNPHKMRMIQTSEYSKFQFGYRGPLVTISDQLSSWWPSWMAAITRNYKSGCHYTQSQQRDLQQKLNTIKFGSIFNLNMLSALLTKPNTIEMTAMALSFVIFGYGWQHNSWAKVPSSQKQNFKFFHVFWVFPMFDSIWSRVNSISSCIIFKESLSKILPFWIFIFISSQTDSIPDRYVVQWYQFIPI